MSDYYSRTGDNGTTGLLGNTRVPKEHLRLETVGTLDEANAALGIARAFSQQKRTREILLDIQRDLYNIMAEVAATPENADHFRVVDSSRVNWLETQADMIGDQFEMPKGFIVPGDSQSGAALDLARTVVRRAERRLSSMLHQGDLENSELLRYLNRVSSLCFVLELWETNTSSDSPITSAKDGVK